MRGHPGGPEAAAIEETIAPSEREVYRQQVLSLLTRGYQPSLELAETAYTMLELRRIRASIEADRTGHLQYLDAKAHVETLTQAGVGEDDPALLQARREVKDAMAAGGTRDTSQQTFKALGDFQATLRAQIQILDKRQAAQTANDPEREFRLAEQWVQEHLGEFEARCPNPSCGEILTLPALPHWAFTPVMTKDGPVHMVWSPELWSMVVDGTISLWVMAFTLRTSPEALKLTAQLRGEPWPASIELVAEERLLDVRLQQLHRQALALTP